MYQQCCTKKERIIAIKDLFFTVYFQGVNFLGQLEEMELDAMEDIMNGEELGSDVDST